MRNGNNQQEPVANTHQSSYHRGFVKDFAVLSEPLYGVAGKNKFRWDKEQQHPFDALKNALTSPPLLALPNHEDEFILDTDASNVAIGAELIQVQNGEEKVIAYGSYALTHEQRNYCVTRRELLAVVRFTRQYRYYLLGKPFTVRTDHSSLTWLLNFKEPQGQLARWMEELSQYNIILRHRPGKKHTNADALSRIVTEEKLCSHYGSGVNIADLPCRGCNYCKRANEQWGKFISEVDEAVPLVSTKEKGQRTVGRSAGVPKGAGIGRPVSEETSSQIPGVFGGSQDTSGALRKNRSIMGDGGPIDCREALRVDLVNPEETDSREGVQPCIWGISASDGGLEGVDKVPAGNTSSWCRVMHQEMVSQEPLVGGRGQVNSIGMEGGGQTCASPGTYGGGPLYSSAELFDSPRLQDLEAEVDVASQLLIAKVGEEYTVEMIGVFEDQSTADEPSSWGFTVKELREAQEKDEDLKICLQWLKTKEVPDGGVLFLASPAGKYFWLNKEMLCLVDGVLYMDTGKEDKKLVVPESLKEKAVSLNHDLPSAAHQGVARTKARMKDKFFWHCMSEYVRNFVSTCSTCSKNKKNDKYGRCPMTEFHASAPMERVHIDFMGPLPKTPRGNQHILMMVDQFTKWVECVPLLSQTAEITARAAVNEFFSRFGCPFQIHSDQGRNFEGKLFAALCKVLEIHKTRTTPYRPSSNGQVERYNRTLMDAVRCFIGKSQNQWDLNLQQIAGALRASVNRSTGFTPNKLMLGREVNTPASLMFPSGNKGDQDQEPETYVASLTGTIQEAHNTARVNLKTSLKRMKRNYDLRLMTRQYERGDVVHLLDTASIKGKCKKLSSPWKGPGVIVKKFSAYIYRVKLKNAVFVTNHDRLKPCRDRNQPTWIRQWKQKQDEYEEDEDDEALYCVCRRPCEGRFMILCDFCNEWFHGSCVNVTPTEALDIERFKCKGCVRAKK